MTAVTSPSDVAHPFTVADLEGMPDDGRRYELIDGELLVSPAPGWAHQAVVLALSILLDQACPAELRVLAAPFAVRPDKFNEVQPDVLVDSFSFIRASSSSTAWSVWSAAISSARSGPRPWSKTSTLPSRWSSDRSIASIRPIAPTNRLS